MASPYHGNEFQSGDNVEFQNKPGGRWQRATVIQYYHDDSGAGYLLEPVDQPGVQIKSNWRVLRRYQINQAAQAENISYIVPPTQGT